MKLKISQTVLPLGFQASGVSAGIKRSGKADLALFVSEAPCATAAMMTTNAFKAAPLVVSIRHLSSGHPRALVANSGNANCMTGKQGLADALAMAACVAHGLEVVSGEVLVASTGIIGKPLPMEKIRAGVPEALAALSSKGLADAARAIMTTDTFPKVASVRAKIGGRVVTVSGVAKGAGMIAPKMKTATMLAFCFTDARIEQAALRQIAGQVFDASFNAITIDGCMSTNDMAVVMANGCAGNRAIKKGSPEAAAFSRLLRSICLSLARMIVEDAEGATKFIEVRIMGARTGALAKNLAFGVANSNLFKCAMFGSDPNWGRIAAALGSVDSRLQEPLLRIALNGTPVFKDGKPVAVKNRELLKGRHIVVDVAVGRGPGRATVYTSDLSYGYVRINADYN
ncbi:MAG: bifunctional glutamate N-acetyltransferase/amino-acid acetyltransferase ArgJ [Candidatus Omnitrophica bacterium]|nr:bifunctional glutamate N-acetyltransferase/amino-acid acetyltransferase ArgJ [Candidatus Omnitrophota bacterium]